MALTGHSQATIAAAAALTTTLKYWWNGSPAEQTFSLAVQSEGITVVVVLTGKTSLKSSTSFPLAFLIMLGRQYDCKSSFSTSPCPSLRLISAQYFSYLVGILFSRSSVYNTIYCDFAENETRQKVIHSRKHSHIILILLSRCVVVLLFLKH